MQGLILSDTDREEQEIHEGFKSDQTKSERKKIRDIWQTEKGEDLLHESASSDRDSWSRVRWAVEQREKIQRQIESSGSEKIES